MSKRNGKLFELNTVRRDNNISAETIDLNDDSIFELKKCAGTIKCYRNESYERHLLIDVVIITFFAVLANADEWTKIEAFAKAKKSWLRKYLEMPYEPVLRRSKNVPERRKDGGHKKEGNLIQ